MKNLRVILLLIVASASFISCAQKEPQPSSEEFDVLFSVPESVELDEGQTSLTFRILFGKAPQKTDVVVFKDSNGNSHDCKITDIQSKEFTISLFQNYFADNYEVGIRRSDAYKEIGKMLLSIRYKDIELENGVTVYGKVFCDGKPVAGAVLSDGVEVVQTNSEGFYQMKSAKKYGYVFVSVPSGYEVPSNGIL
ncbi:MAG: metallophosphoesterase N-terminal domain-containing protein, partial [Candidatus Cryptobacteroides sp.]